MTLKEFVGKNGKEKCVSKMRQWQSVTMASSTPMVKTMRRNSMYTAWTLPPVLKSWRSFSPISVLKTISPRTRYSRFVW